MPIPIGFGAEVDLTLIVPGDVNGWPSHSSLLLIYLTAISLWKFFCFFLSVGGVTYSLPNLEMSSDFSILSYLSWAARTWLAR